MTSITYGHGFLSDGDDITDWNENNSGLTGQSISVDNGDYFKIAGTCDNAADEYVYYEYDIAPNLSSDTYTKYLLRWKTSASSSGLGAKVILGFTAGSQTVLGGTNPEFSTEWNVSSGTVTASKTIDKIQLWADDHADAVDAGTFYVYYDFVLLHKDTFVFPHSGTEARLTFPPRLPVLEIPGRSGDISQNLGSHSAQLNLLGADMELDSDWKRTGDTIEGEVLLDIWHNMTSEPWQWLDFEKGQMKVTLASEPYLLYSGGSGFNVNFREKRRGDASEESYIERLGISL